MSTARTKKQNSGRRNIFKKYLPKPLDKQGAFCYNIKRRRTSAFDAAIAQSVEHVIGNDEVIGPNPISSSITKHPANRRGVLLWSRYGAANNPIGGAVFGAEQKHTPIYRKINNVKALLLSDIARRLFW